MVRWTLSIHHIYLPGSGEVQRCTGQSTPFRGVAMPKVSQSQPLQGGLIAWQTYQHTYYMAGLLHDRLISLPGRSIPWPTYHMADIIPGRDITWRIYYTDALLHNRVITWQTHCMTNLSHAQLMTGSVRGRLIP